MYWYWFEIGYDSGSDGSGGSGNNPATIPPDMLTITPRNAKRHKLKLKDIYFVEALKDYVVINTLEKRYTIHSTMKDIESRLPSDSFMRVHRSFIINIERIAAIEQPNVILENDKKVVPIGGSYKEALNERINLM